MLPVSRLLTALMLLIAAGAGAAESRTVTVTGNGFATVTPDIARVQMSVVERNPSLEVAQQAAAKVTDRVLKLTDGLGVKRQQVNTTGASVRPDYRWNRAREEQELIGYVVERSIEIELRDLDKLGDLIEGAVKAGVNQVRPPILDSSKRREIYREALAAAAADARANAAILTDAMDARLGEVESINAASGGYRPPPQPMRMQADMAMAESAPQTYSAGDIRFDATITAVFSLL